MRRKRGTLLPIEEAILAAGIELRLAGTPAFHGFLVAKSLREHDEARRLTAHGTLYKALDRLERGGCSPAGGRTPSWPPTRGGPGVASTP